MGKNKSLDPFNYHEITNKLVLGSIPHKREHIDELASIGIDIIYSLTETPIAKDLTYYIRINAMYQGLYPFPDGGVPAEGQLDNLFAYLDNPDNGKAYIHCRGGVGRSGIVAIAYLRHKGHSLDEAKRLVAKRHNAANIKAGPVTQIQRDFVEALR